MKQYSTSQLYSYDVVVVGTGHAGCEAALASARGGARTLLVAPNLDRVGYMPCNPSIGGPGKSQIVAEVDALGGAMAMVADSTAMQVRELNASKGPAVRAIRIQCDKTLYALAMKEVVEQQDGLELLQDEAVALHVGVGASQVDGVQLRIAGRVTAKAIVITAGTFLRAQMIAGESQTVGGRAGEFADTRLAGGISDLGFRTRRFKTGTPPRIDARTIDPGAFEAQLGDEAPRWLSRAGKLGRIEPLDIGPSSTGLFAHPQLRGGRWQVPCFQASTNETVHDLIRANLHRAPMYNGSIEGTGPRYCPSIEDKVGRFADKSAHPIFLEPEGWRSHELYIQGMSTSLPPDVQSNALRAIPGLEECRITRFGYAVEYDALDPSELSETLESKRVRGLFFAGQVNGTSGYEEAAGQGIVAGANAASRITGRAPVVIRRDDGYIGVMIEDLITKPFTEPYRMLTSRAEHRLVLRTDTADGRLAKKGAAAGIVSDDRAVEIEQEQQALHRIETILKTTWLGANANHSAVLTRHELHPANRSMTALDILGRPGVGLDQVIDVLRDLDRWTGPDPDHLTLERAEIAARYAPFIDKEQREIERTRQSEHRELDDSLDYQLVKGLRVEAAHRLAEVRPRTFGQAARLAAVTPSDLGALLVHVTGSRGPQRKREAARR